MNPPNPRIPFDSLNKKKILSDKIRTILQPYFDHLKRLGVL